MIKERIIVKVVAGVNPQSVILIMTKKKKIISMN